jgi:hypothetical protein
MSKDGYLPPGVSVGMLPGNRPEDEKFDTFWDEIDLQEEWDNYDIPEETDEAVEEIRKQYPLGEDAYDKYMPFHSYIDRKCEDYIADDGEAEESDRRYEEYRDRELEREIARGI